MPFISLDKHKAASGELRRVYLLISRKRDCYPKVLETKFNFIMTNIPHIVKLHVKMSFLF